MNPRKNCPFHKYRHPFDCINKGKYLPSKRGVVNLQREIITSIYSDVPHPAE